MKTDVLEAKNGHRITTESIIDEIIQGVSIPEQPVNTIDSKIEGFDAYRITKEKVISNPPPFGKIGESPIFARANITPVTAESKAGKTAFQTAVVAGAISRDGIYDGFTDMYIEPNTEGKAVIVINTEESEADQQYGLNTALKRNSFNNTPDYFWSCNIRTLPITEYQKFTKNLFELLSKKFNGIHLIVIDGGADYIPSVNDETEANAAISFFIWLAVTYHCPVLLVIHLNENAGRNGDTMPRGHVGRQAVRKGYCQLHITKSGDVSTLQVLRARKAGTDTPLICYQYSTDMGYHISVDADIANARTSKSSTIRRGLEKIVESILPASSSLSYTALVSKLMQATDKSTPTIKRYINDLTGWDTIEKGEDGNYRIKTIRTD